MTDRAIDRLRPDEVRIESPAGTDIPFQLGDRPFDKQDRDAYRARAEVRVDYDVELGR